MSVLESFLMGKEARRQADAAGQISAMNAYLQQNGQAIFAGDQNALAQLAGFGPQGLQLAMGMQGDIQARERQAAMDAQAAADREYQMGRQEKQDARADEQWRIELEAFAAEKTAAEREAMAAQLENTVKAGLAIQSPEQWDAFVTQNGAPELAGQFENREALAAQYMSMAEVLKTYGPQEAPKPSTEIAKLKADLDAGLITQADYEAEMARRAPKGTTLTVDPATGAVTYSEGAGVGGGGPSSGDALRAQITDTQSMLDMISGIANDPALPGVTGSLEGGGGNNVDEFGALQRAYYGDAGLGVIQKIAQLQGNAWLGARALLKGGGQITDYESKKAESAMARLSRAQGDKEFVAALKDLEDALRDGLAKLEGKGAAAKEAAPAPDSAMPQAGTVEDGYRFKGGDPSDPANWEAVDG